MPHQSISIESGHLAIPPENADGVRGFKGVPFAAPPVGALRWRAPEPPLPWSGVRSASEYGWNSLQGVVFDDIDPSVPGVSEDCLYLNVWTPGHRRAARPAGAVLDPRRRLRRRFRRGAALRRRPTAAKGIVVVTVNHRLNALGFLAHPELTAESGASGHWGLLDLAAALKWVQRNIAAFGGDPAAVTIAGKSAGSMAVSALMASPLAKGLFARAIGESGAIFASPSRAPSSLGEAEERGEAFARDVGARSLAELRAAPAEAILAAAPGLGFRPIVDGQFLPRPPAEIFARGEQSDVPLLAGWTKDEGFNFTLLQGENADGRYPDLVREMFGDRAEACLALYPSGSPEIDKTSARELGGDLTIIHGAWAWIEAQKATGRAEIYRFRFDRAPLTPAGWFGARPSRDAGAFHSCEIPYVFDNLEAVPWLYAPEDHTIAAIASGWWVNFVKTGNPNGAGLPHWPPYRREPLVLGIDARPAAIPDTERERHQFLASVVAGPVK